MLVFFPEPQVLTVTDVMIKLGRLGLLSLRFSVVTRLSIAYESSFRKLSVQMTLCGSPTLILHNGIDTKLRQMDKNL